MESVFDVQETCGISDAVWTCLLFVCCAVLPQRSLLLLWIGWLLSVQLQIHREFLCVILHCDCRKITGMVTLRRQYVFY